MFIASYLFASLAFVVYAWMQGIIVAAADPLSIVLGSLGGIAAIVMAINTIQLRREAKRERAAEAERNSRMNTFEMSQASLLAALARSDAEVARLNGRVEAQEEVIGKHEETISGLKTEVRRLRRELEDCTRERNK